MLHITQFSRWITLGVVTQVCLGASIHVRVRSAGQVKDINLTLLTSMSHAASNCALHQVNDMYMKSGKWMTVALPGNDQQRNNAMELRGEGDGKMIKFFFSFLRRKEKEIKEKRRQQAHLCELGATLILSLYQDRKHLHTGLNSLQSDLKVRSDCCWAAKQMTCVGVVREPQIGHCLHGSAASLTSGGKKVTRSCCRWRPERFILGKRSGKKQQTIESVMPAAGLYAVAESWVQSFHWIRKQNLQECEEPVPNGTLPIGVKMRHSNEALRLVILTTMQTTHAEATKLTTTCLWIALCINAQG
jgi:hypothetical protein